MSTNNKVALVTGGSRGLGKDISIQLAKKGFDVILTYQNNNAAAQDVVREIESLGKKAVALQIDVAHSSSFESFANTVKETLTNDFGTSQLHSLVNNAGIGAYAPFESTTEEEFDNMINIHLKAPYFLTQKILPVISDGGSVVNISTGLVRFTFNNYSAYAIAKAGVETLSRYQALELGNRKIRVNTVAPGAVATDFGGGAFRDNQEVQGMIANMTALGRIGLPDDIGSVVAFLCSEDAKWINAQRLEVAGGIYI